jgi:photosystem II stability/assembly factor-like uncharacterized protein
LAIVVTGGGCLLSGSSTPDESPTGGGVYKSTDSGSLWMQTTAFPTSGGVGNIGTAEILSMASDPQDHEVVYAGTSENGLVVSYDSAASWQSPRDEDLQKGAIVALAVDPKNICVVYAAFKTALFKTETCGREFFSVYDEALEKIEIKKIALDWYNDGTLYLGLSNGDLLKSVNGGRGWNKVAAFGKKIIALAVSNQDSRVILVGGEGGFWKSVDAGASWVEKNNALKNFRDADNIYDLTQDATGASWLLASEYGILRSVDAGENWAALNLLTSAGQVEIKDLVMDTKDADKIFYATNLNFYASSDGGESWETTKFDDDGWIVSTLLLDAQNSAIIYLGKKKD